MRKRGHNSLKNCVKNDQNNAFFDVFSIIFGLFLTKKSDKKQMFPDRGKLNERAKRGGICVLKPPDAH